MVALKGNGVASICLIVEVYNEAHVVKSLLTI